MNGYQGAWPRPDAWLDGEKTQSLSFSLCSTECAASVIIYLAVKCLKRRTPQGPSDADENIQTRNTPAEPRRTKKEDLSTLYLFSPSECFYEDSYSYDSEPPECLLDHKANMRDDAIMGRGG